MESSADVNSLDKASSLTSQVVSELEHRLLLENSKSPCFPVRNDNGTYDCVMMTAPVSSLKPEFKEIGALLPETLHNINAWLAFLKTLQISDAQLLSIDNAESGPQRGGNAAGNFLWLFQSLGKTVTRTRELVKVNFLLQCVFLILECSHY